MGEPKWLRIPAVFGTVAADALLKISQEDHRGTLISFLLIFSLFPTICMARPRAETDQSILKLDVL